MAFMKPTCISFTKFQYTGYFYYQHNGRYYNHHDNTPSIAIFSNDDPELGLCIYTDTFGVLTKLVYLDNKGNEYCELIYSPLFSESGSNAQTDYHLKGDIREMINILVAFGIDYNENYIVTSSKASKEISKYEKRKIKIFHHAMDHGLNCKCDLY